jgi:hypothetical protein
MPNRPPKDWFDRCSAGVAARGHPVNPAAVCGAVWRDKTPAERAVTKGLEETMAAKKKHGRHKAKKGAKRRASAHMKARRTAPRKAHRKDQHHHKCPACGHLERHDTKAGCTHFDGHRFCPCRHRHR